MEGEGARVFTFTHLECFQSGQVLNLAEGAAVQVEVGQARQLEGGPPHTFQMLQDVLLGDLEEVRGKNRG
jgi:hypothetical protein